jgi:peptide-methionine (R)-S-oxide reductase
MDTQDTQEEIPLDQLPKTEEEWKARLTPEQYEILRGHGTEAAFTGPLLEEHRDGTFRCAACGQALFASGTKFESGSGWPSFDQAIPGSVDLVEDTSYGMHRTEVLCSRCHSHLGHVFNDGPTETTGQRFCMNSASLKFQQK